MQTYHGSRWVKNTIMPTHSNLFLQTQASDYFLIKTCKEPLGFNPRNFNLVACISSFLAMFPTSWNTKFLHIAVFLMITNYNIDYQRKRISHLPYSEIKLITRVRRCVKLLCEIVCIIVICSSDFGMYWHDCELLLIIHSML